MSDIAASILGGGLGAAIVTGIVALVQYFVTRKDKKSDKGDITKKALRYIMLYIIQERAKEHLQDGKITLDERRALHHWHELYHVGLGGNGDATALMEAVDRLPLDTEG